MLLKKRALLALTVMLLLGMAAWALAAGSMVDQRGVLAGAVLAKDLAVAGTTVREGAILVYVDTVTGPAVALRANTDGVVREVLVRAGDRIKTGDVLVRIESTKR